MRGLLLDYSGTLFRLEPGGAPAHGLDADAQDALFASLTAPVRPYDGPKLDLGDDWDRRDLDPDAHRRVFTARILAAGAPEAIYDLIPAPESWRPYPDTAEALRTAKAAGLRVAVVSNIAWEIADVFEAHGVGDLVDEYVLSFTEGVMKPDPKIFRSACERLGAAPADTLMIGDSAVADGAAVDVGCRFERVEPLRTDLRPNALINVLRGCGITA